MKRTIAPLYTIFLLLVFTATLTVRVVLHQFGSLRLTSTAAQNPLFNATFLKCAATDIGEPRLKQEIDELLDGNLKSRGRHRSFLSAGIDVMIRSARGGSRLRMSFRRYLGDWSRKRRFYSDAMVDLVSGVKVLIDRKKDKTVKYKSCAVVGNSGILLNKKHGKLIDSHEVVIRLNNARIRRFERNVGAKTSISFVNSNILHLCSRREGCFCHPYGDNVPMVMYICQPAHFLDYLICNSSHKAPLIVTDPRFDVLCGRIVKYYSVKRLVEVIGKDVGEWGPIHEGSNFHYSSGMQAVMLAIGVCDKVSIFGFGKTGLAKHHYHTTQNAELSLHDYEAEYDLYKDLMERPQVIPFISDKFNFPPVVMYN